MNNTDEYREDGEEITRVEYTEYVEEREDSEEESVEGESTEEETESDEFVEETGDTAEYSEEAAAEPSPDEEFVEDKPPHLEYMEDILDVLRRFGQVINTATLYGSEHMLTDTAADEAYGALELLLDNCPRVNLSVSEDSVFVEGTPTEKGNPFINMLSSKLNELNIAGFSLLRGMPEEEFRSLIDLLVKPPDNMADAEGFAEALADRNLEFIQPERVKYERVTEDEAVVNKDMLEEEEEDTGPLVQQVLAFLKGDTSSMEGTAGKHLEKMTNDAESLANLIMEAAAVRQTMTSVGSGESLANIVVGCLRRSFTGLMGQPSAKTKKGRKNIKKSLLLLEKTVLDRLHSMTEEDNPELDSAIEAAMEEMGDELEIEDLTVEYLKKREAFKKTEKRVVRYLNGREYEELDGSSLEDRFYDGGMSDSDWRELLVQGGVQTPQPQIAPFGGQDAAAGLGALATLLSELDRMMEATEDTAVIKEKAVEVGEGVENLTDSTSRKIDDLQDKIADAEKALDDIDEDQREAVKMSRAAMMELLAEIVQELCQSLSAINCAVGMTRAGHIGDINKEQDEVLGVASKCGQRLDELLNRLIEIVGLPSGLEPDKESVYNTGSPSI